MTEEFLVEELTLPTRADAPDTVDLHAVVAAINAVCRADSGVDHLDETAAEVLARLRSDADQVCRTFVVRDAGVIVGVLVFCYATAEKTSASFDIAVLPKNWGKGIEETLLSRAEAETRALGRDVLQIWTMHPGTATETPIPAATGWGAVSETPLTSLLLSHGFKLEQAERNSTFDLHGSFSVVEDLLAAAWDTAGSEYRPLEWTLPTPPEVRDGYAWALSRMSTDVPAGALAVDEEVWDAERVARRDARFREAGQILSVSAVEHVPTGQIAAFNELVIDGDRRGVTHNYCTLVLKEHRGHRLGTIVKSANLLRWRNVAPDSPKVSTFNAEENRPMLDINEAMGFVPVAYAAAWQKRL